MTSADVTLQAQISSVLDSLIKAAVGELTRLFDARASARCTVHSDAQEYCKGQTNKTFTSIAVQVDGGTLCLDQHITDQCCSLEGSEKSVRRRRKREDPLLEPLLDPLLDPLLVEANEPTDQRTSVLREDEISSSRNPESSTEELHTNGSDSNTAVPNTQAKQKQRSNKTKGKNGRNARNKTKLFLQKEETQAPAPEPECPEAAAQVKPPEAGVSTAKHTPVSTHGPYLRVSLWDRLATIRDMMNEPKKTKTSQDQKLLQPCSVQLVNLSLVERRGKMSSVVGGSDGAQGKSGTPKDLCSHQSVHTGHRLCCFTKCGNGLWRLQRLVSQSNSHCCKICGKRFKRRKVLRRHERFHTGEKPYACPRCHKAFALRKSLRRHQRFHTGEKPHICTQCGKSFRLRDNLKAHLRFHTGERPFTCPVCSKSFRISRNLTEHQLSHL